MSFCEEEMEVFVSRTSPNHLNTSNTYVLIAIRCLPIFLRRLLALLRNGIFFN